MSKVVKSLKEAIQLSGLKDGMTISFHHHLRGGDFVMNMVLDAIAELGIRDINVNITSLHGNHGPIIDHIKTGVVTGIETSYTSNVCGKPLSTGILGKPVKFTTHGGRASAILSGKDHIDVTFIGAPAADCMGNLSGKFGPSACGTLGYAFADAMCADKVVVVTDNLMDYPLAGYSINETYVDYVVEVDKIGDPAGIVSGTTKITKDPVGLCIADYAAKLIKASGLLKDGFSFQTGAGGASLAAAKFLKDIMLEEKIQGSFGMGGITGYMVEMLEAGCFQKLIDVQCFDLKAVESCRTNPNHLEVTAAHYAGPDSKSAAVDSLDVVILGATQIDTDFNVNVHTDSNGYLIGGSGGHTDTAAASKLAIIVAPLVRARLSIVVDHVLTVSTPGSTVDALVTQYGIAVNPARGDLKDRLVTAGLPVVDIHDLAKMAEEIAGKPAPLKLSDKIVANVLNRDGSLLDTVRAVL